MKRPLVSAIVSTYNSEKFIEEKIIDLLQQTLVDDLEIIIINSGSMQNEEKIIKEYINIYNNIIYLKTEERETVYKAWNRGISISHGKYITNSNTDDRLKNDAFEILSKTLEENPDVAMVYANQNITHIPNQSFNDAYKCKTMYFPDFNKIHQLERCLVGSQPMWRSLLHFEHNLWFNEKYEVCGDNEFEIRVSDKFSMLHLHQTLGTFYKSLQKTNKEYENQFVTNSEGVGLTFYSMQLFINSLNEKDLKDTLRKYKFLADIPFLLYRIYRKVMTLVFYKKYFQHPESIYLITIFALKRQGNFEKAKFYSEKFLKNCESIKIDRLFNFLSSNEIYSNKEILSL